jgi:thiol-disulfide isomerase/thioredoxin
MTRERAAGLGLLAALGAALVLNGAFIARSAELLRPVRAGDLAPPISLPGLDGSRSDLAALRGQVVLVDFWATWCGGCRETLPDVEALYERYRSRGFYVLSVNVDQGNQRRRAERFVEAFRPTLTFPIYLDDGAVSRRYHVQGIPHFVLIDRRGYVRAAGNLAPDRLDNLIETLL